MLVWMDLEMTGLDHTREVIVEIATLITDDQLEIVAEGPDLVVHQPDELLVAMDPFVVDMHTKSGLLDLVKASTLTLEDAGAATMAFIREHVPEPGSVPLCGNSIGTDRRFLAKYLPEIEDYLHYRSVDVSSVKELARLEAGVAPGARRHPRERRRAAAVPRPGVQLCRRGRRPAGEAGRRGSGDRAPRRRGGDRAPRRR